MAGKLLITPNDGSVTAGSDPKIQFQGTGNSTDITLRTATDGALSFEGAAGQLLAVTDSMTGTIFSANDVSGMPSIEVIDTGLVKLAQYSGNVVLGSGTDNAIAKLQVTGAASATGGLVLAKTSGVGIKIDTAAPDFGWRDLTADIQVRGTGAADPTFSIYGATVLRQYSFSATIEQEVFLVYHVPHDYVPGTSIYFHAHWSNAAATPNTGSVVWGFDYSYAKGFNQAAFPTPTTITVTQASPATRYQHNIAETAAVSIAAMEIDGLLLVRGYRKAADAADTCTDAVFLHTMDVHYQSTNMATKQKAPNFYV